MFRLVSSRLGARLGAARLAFPRVLGGDLSSQETLPRSLLATSAVASDRRTQSLWPVAAAAAGSAATIGGLSFCHGGEAGSSTGGVGGRGGTKRVRHLRLLHISPYPK
jgi:hypothetical protein